jgi:hypothetical protein
VDAVTGAVAEDIKRTGITSRLRPRFRLVWPSFENIVLVVDYGAALLDVLIKGAFERLQVNLLMDLVDNVFSEFLVENKVADWM